MTKEITSPVERWAGTVVIADPLTISQARAVEQALNQSDIAEGKIWLSTIDEQQLPAVFACVTEWRIESLPKDLTIDNFPASPRGDSHKFIEWIFREIMAVYVGEIKVPNE